MLLSFANINEKLTLVNEIAMETIHSIYLFIWGFTSLSTLYRSYHDGQWEGQRKPVHTVP